MLAFSKLRPDQNLCILAAVARTFSFFFVAKIRNFTQNEFCNKPIFSKILQMVLYIIMLAAIV